MEENYEKKYIKYKLKYLSLQKAGSISKLTGQYNDCLKRNNYDGSKCDKILTDLNNNISKEQSKLDKEYNTQVKQINKMSNDADAYLKILGRPFNNDVNEEELDQILNEANDMNAADILRRMPSVPKKNPGVISKQVTPPQKSQQIIPPNKVAPQVIPPNKVVPQTTVHTCTDCATCLRVAYNNTDTTMKKSNIMKCYDSCKECNKTDHMMAKSSNFIKHYNDILNVRIEEEQNKINISKQKIDQINKEIVYNNRKRS